MKQPLSEQLRPEDIKIVQDALLAMSDAGTMIQQLAYNALEGHASLEEALQGLDEQTAYLASLLPLLRLRLVRKEQMSPEPAETDFEQERRRITASLTDMAQSVVLVPIIGIVAT